MLNRLLAQVGELIPLRYLVLDGYFGNKNALQMAKACGLCLISKLRVDAALYFPPTMPYAGRGHPPSSEHAAFSVLALKARYRGLKPLHETLKI